MTKFLAAFSLATLLVSGGASAGDPDDSWQAVCAQLPANDPCHLVLKYNAARADAAARNAARAADQSQPAEVPMCAGRMTRDGCQPR